jgi:elongation factor P
MIPAMPRIDTSRMRAGLCVELDDGPYVIMELQHVKPGKGGAFVRMKLRSLTGGGVLDRTLRSGETLDQANVSNRTMQFLYPDGTRLVFMDQQSYDQLEIERDFVEGADMLKEGTEVSVQLHNERPVGVDLPNFVVLEVAETAPPERGAAGRTKPATLETGAVIHVPAFIDRGEKLKIDTRTRTYVERA